MASYKQTLKAGVPARILDAGNFFRLVSLSAATKIDVRTMRGGRVYEVNEGVPASFYFKLQSGFDGVELLSTVDQDVVFLIADDEAGTAETSGVVTIQNANGPFTSGLKNITTASQVFSVANPSRRYLLIQNQHATGNIYVNFGAAAVAGQCLKIAPGGSYVAEVFAPNNSINIIGDVANNNVVMIEG